MIETGLYIRKSRDIRDRVMGRTFKVVRRFPGGREIVVRKARSRPQAVRRAHESRSITPAGFPARTDDVIALWRETPLAEGSPNLPLY